MAHYNFFFFIYSRSSTSRIFNSLCWQLIVYTQKPYYHNMLAYASLLLLGQARANGKTNITAAAASAASVYDNCTDSGRQQVWMLYFVS